jgi:hypothetical protein
VSGPYPSVGLYPGLTTFPGVSMTIATGNLIYPRPGQYPRPGLYPGVRTTGGSVASLPADAAELFKQAIRGSVAITYTVDASLGTTAIDGAQDLAPTGGNITDTLAPGVRRVLSLDLAPAPGLFDLLSPAGVRLTVTAHIRYTSRAVFDLAMGVFDVDTETLKEGGGGLSLTAPDKWVRIMRAKFVKPQASTKGARVTQQIKTLIQGALGNTEPVVITATSKATVPALVWESDRAQAITDLASGIGAWVFFDRQGVATIADVPTVGAVTDWLIDASESGVLLSLDRSRSRTSTYNVVAVHSTAAAGPAFPDVYVWDGLPSSPTYAGPNPITHPELAGPFGVVTYHFDTPLPLTASGARQAGLTVLARTTALAAQASATQVPNPAVDATDVVELLAPRERRDLSRAVERHMVATVTHSLDVTQSQTIQTSSTRTDAFT